MSTSGVSRTRATNLTGLIDIDALVEANLIRQKTKLNTATQKLKVQQYKQEQYREIQSKAKTFYNKYFDVLSGDSLFNSKTYNVMKATSTDSTNVTATASTKAKAGNYSVTVTSSAQAAKFQMTEQDFLDNDRIAINNEIYTLSGTDAKERAANLQKQLTEKGVNIEAKFSEFVDSGKGGLIIQTTDTGADAELSIVLENNIAAAFNNITVNSGKDAASDALLSNVSTFFSDLEDEGTRNNLENGSYFSINDNGIKLSQDAIEKMRVEIDDNKRLDILKDSLNEGIAADNDLKGKYTAEVENGNIVFKAVNSENSFQCKVNNSDVNVTAGYASKSDVISINDVIGDGTNADLIINGETISFDKTAADKRASLKDALDAKGYTLNDDNTIVSKSTSGSASKFTCQVKDNTKAVGELSSTTAAAAGLGSVIKGSDAEVTIRDLNTGLEYTHKGGSNEIELDDVTFKIDRNAAVGSTTNITVKADGTELKDKIVEFIDDYNDLLGSINTKLYEKYDRNYLPLTDEDKEGLTDKEIEQLETKAKTGLLRNDSFLSNFADDMKMTMSSVMRSEWGGSSAGLSLEKIGIKPVQDYTSKNGLFTVDEDTLLEAIESNIDGVKELFTRGSGNISSSESDGIFVKLKNNLYEHATGTFSRLAERAGVADGVTANTNEMTKDIEDRKKQIALMEQALKDKEDALYTRYSTLESTLASLQSQQSSLASYFQ